MERAWGTKSRVIQLDIMMDDRGKGKESGDVTLTATQTVSSPYPSPHLAKGHRPLRQTLHYLEAPWHTMPHPNPRSQASIKTIKDKGEFVRNPRVRITPRWLPTGRLHRRMIDHFPTFEFPYTFFTLHLHPSCDGERKKQVWTVGIIIFCICAPTSKRWENSSPVSCLTA